ncbi:MAG: hypothetical protein GX417_05245 [Clostridiales bacterium]|nr:hypothetical protein [Clostridiales bacterium]
METQYDPQQTLSEFFDPGKAHRVWKIIFAVLLSAMIIGAAYEFTRPQADPVRMSADLPGGTYAYLDVQLLSDWVYDVSGDEDYTFYEAMDPDSNWYIVSLDKSKYDQLAYYTDAYIAFFSDDDQNYSYPEPTRLTGMTRLISSSDASQLATYYGASSTDVTDYFGSYYFNEGANDRYEGAFFYLLGAFFFCLLFLVLVLQDGAIGRNLRKSEERLYKFGKWDDAENQFLRNDIRRYDKAKLALSQDFVYAGVSGSVLSFEDIGWLYRRKQRSYGITVATQLVAGLTNGKTVYLASRAANDQFIAEVAQEVLRKNPNCLIGYSFENIRTYRQRVKEYKLNHPK